MTEKIKAHVDLLFKSIPQSEKSTAVKNQVLGCAINRYTSLVSEGKSEDEAFSISISEIGDINAILQGNSVTDSDSFLKQKRRNAVLLAVAIMLYIVCVVPIIVLDGIGANDTIGIVLMFILAAVATGLLIYRSGTSIKYTESPAKTENNNFVNEKGHEESPIFKAVNSAVWAFTLVIYFVLSFLTGAWYITWLIFIIGGAVTNIIKAILDLKK